MPATLYLSAHPDDAVLSCGGTLALDASAPTRDAATAPVTLVTVFTPPRDGAARLAEDRRAAEVLGCGYRSLDLPAALSRPEVRGPADVFAPLGPPHLGLLSEIVARVRPLLSPGSRLVAPLGVGGHIDHRLLYTAARALRDATGAALSFYEDQPYARAAHAVALRLALIGARLVVPQPDIALEATSGSGERAVRAAHQALLLSLPGVLPAGLLRPARARWQARLAWTHDRAADQPGRPPRLRPEIHDVTAAQARWRAALEAYATQWPRYAASVDGLVLTKERRWLEE